VATEAEAVAMVMAAMVEVVMDVTVATTVVVRA
jgi:hypothetical protein